MKYKEKLIEYFKAFSDKDIDSLSKMFSDQISLVDWNISAIGKKKVVDINQNIFDNVKTIKVTPIDFYCNSNTSYAIKILIIIDEDETLNVIDIINFDDNGMITSITAFKYEN